MQPIDLRNPRWQRSQMESLDSKQLTRHRAEMLFVSGVDLIAPLPRPLIQILPTAECATREEIPLDKAERPLHPPGTVRMAACAVSLVLAAGEQQEMERRMPESEVCRKLKFLNQSVCRKL